MPIVDPSHPIAQLLQRDRRYKLDAYLFVLEALSFAQESLGLGEEPPVADLEPYAVDEAGDQPVEERAAVLVAELMSDRVGRVAVCFTLAFAILRLVSLLRLRQPGSPGGRTESGQAPCEMGAQQATTYGEDGNLCRREPQRPSSGWTWTRRSGCGRRRSAS